MNKYLPLLEKTALFHAISTDEIENLLDATQYTITRYQPDEMIALEEEPCPFIGIILKGAIETRKISPTGKTITLAHFSKGDLFGEPIVFSSTQLLPASIFAVTDTEILFIPRSDISSLCQKDPRFLENFMRTLSDKTLFLTRKIHLLSLATIRQKICSYLLEQYKLQNSLQITLPISRKKMAEFMGVQRPSLSRELIHMRDEGLLTFEKNQVTILNLQLLEQALFE